MQNKFAVIAMIMILMIGITGTISAATYDSSVKLVEKENFTEGHPDPWQPVDGGVTATVDFNASGNEFAWHAYGTVPNFAGEVAACYALIYYADEDDRFENWGGANPGACIGMFQVDACTGDFDSGDQTTDLGINLPEYPDFNGNPDPWDTYCNEEGDNYEHCCGAKLWIVPCTDYDAPTMTAWNPADYLFETDLIWYDDTDYNVEPSITETTVNPSCVSAGDTVLVGAIVSDGDGEYDLENMIVTTNMSVYGVDEIVVLGYIGMIDCVFANYSANVLVTSSTVDECSRRHMTEFDIYAEDPSGANDSLEAYLDVEPGDCASLGIRDYYTGGEPETKALTQLWWCRGYIHDWYWHNDNALYWNHYSVYGYDAYGNDLGLINDIECCTSFTATIDSPASLEFWGGHYYWWYNNYVTTYNDEAAADVVLRIHCVGNEDVEGDELTIRFLQPVSWLEVTSDVDFVYADECGEPEYFNVTSQIMDAYDEPIPMPGVDVRLYVNSEYCGMIETDDNGTATFVDIYNDVEGIDIINIRAEAECREGTMSVDVVESVLDYIEIYPETSEMTYGDDSQELEYTCFTDHGTEMCCPEEPTWTCNEFAEVDEDGYLTAGDIEGIAVVEANITGVIGTAEIVINALTNCSDEGEIIANEEFTLTSGTVSITGNYSGDNGYACVQAMGIWDPECEDATKYAWVYTNENVTLDLNGTGDMWILNGTEWEFYAAGDTAEHNVLGEGEGDERYALVDPVDPCEGVPCPARTCVGYDLWSYICVDGVCVKDTLLEANSADCGYEAPSNGRSSGRGGGGGGTYPPDPVPTPTPNATTTSDDATPTDPAPADPKPADAKPTMILPGGDTTPDETEDDVPGGIDPTNTIFIMLGIIALIVIGYVLYRKSQNGE